MIAINSGISIAAIPQRRIRWPWVSATLILLAFLLGAHDLQASRRWFKTDKADIRLLAQEESNGRASRQIGFLLLGAVGLMLLTRPAGIALAPNPLIVLPLSMLLIWALISAGWSADPVITLKREVMLLCMLLAAAGLVKHFPVSLLSEIALAHSLFVILLGFTVELVLHSTVPGSEYRFAGTLHPNHMAINASLLLLCSLFIAFDRQDRRFLIIAAVAVLIFFVGVLGPGIRFQ